MIDYSNEVNVQVLIDLLKKYGVRYIIASPGTANMAFVGSVQFDSFFKVYSCVDERSAAYMACGLAQETGESVVLTCTGATASRNYLPGLTEAFYKKLPILSITAASLPSRVGHHVAQTIDRSSLPKDVVVHAVELPIIREDNDFWDCEIKINVALSKLIDHGGGPVHINLPIAYDGERKFQKNWKTRKIEKYTNVENFPEIPDKKIAIHIGSHSRMSTELIGYIDLFCEKYNSLVLCDHTSGYNGKFKVHYAISACQHEVSIFQNQPDILIQLGEICGDYYSSLKITGKEIWRVNEDGIIRDPYKKIKKIFEISELKFFKYLASLNKTMSSCDYFKAFKNQEVSTREKVKDIPFSNIWIAQKLSSYIPQNSTIHFGILNSLRAWNFYHIDDSITSSSNVGGFGIDGILSTIIGASLSNEDKLFFCVLGDLAFFYDMNSLGNRHVSNNLRILIVNNGVGTEFKNFNHPAYRMNNEADKFVAARGHFGQKSKSLVRSYAENLGFKYLSANNKDEFENNYLEFVQDSKIERPIIFEVFTDDEDESNALNIVMNTETSVTGKTKQITKRILGDNGIKAVKKIIKK